MSLLINLCAVLYCPSVISLAISLIVASYLVFLYSLILFLLMYCGFFTVLILYHILIDLSRGFAKVFENFFVYVFYVTPCVSVYILYHKQGQKSIDEI